MSRLCEKLLGTLNKRVKYYETAAIHFHALYERSAAYLNLPSTIKPFVVLNIEEHHSEKVHITKGVCVW